MSLKGDTLLQTQKWWDVILSAFYQYLSTKKNWPTYKYPKAGHHNTSSFLLPPYKHLTLVTAKENYEALSRSLRVHLVNDETITSSKASK